MYCEHAGCFCQVVYQIENACAECELRAVPHPIYDYTDLYEEAQDRIEERRAIYGSEIL